MKELFENDLIKKERFISKNNIEKKKFLQIKNKE